jgi:hypothetical protein
VPARRRIILLLLGTLTGALLAAVASAPAHAAATANSAPDAGNWTTGGRAYDVVRVGGQVIVGGDFTSVGPRTGPLAFVDAETGEVDAGRLPYADDPTSAPIPDGDGGWYVGGGFEELGGVARDGLAHVTAAGTVDPDFAPRLDGAVAALALSPDGRTLYAVGGFDTVDGVARPSAAALDADTGALRPGFDARLSDEDPVVAVAADATSVYIGGTFVRAGGATRTNLAQLDAVTGDATGWAPEPDGDVLQLLLAGDDLYAVGYFIFVEGEVQPRLASFDVTGPAPVLDRAFAPMPDFEVFCVAVADGVVYAAGIFANIGGQARNGVAALDPATGAADPAWDAQLPDPGSVEPRAIAAAGDRVYIGGRLTAEHGNARTNLAQVSAADGSSVDWDPVAGDGIRSLTATDEGVITGGLLETVGGERRRNLAAFDAQDGTPTDFAPETDGHVAALTAGPGDTVFVSGSFATVDGQPRQSLAAVDTLTGDVQDWGPRVDNVVYDVEVVGDTAYLGGAFGFVDDESRERLAAVSMATGALLPWRSTVVGEAVTTIAAHGSALYVAGVNLDEFDGVRRAAAALDLETGALLPWDPFDGVLRGGIGFTRLAIEGDTLVGVGPFEEVADATGLHDRGHAAVYDLSGGEPVLTDADPGADDDVTHVGVHRGVAYLAGDFEALRDQPRDGSGAFDVTTGEPLPWAPERLTADQLDVAGDGTVYTTGWALSDERWGDVGSFSMAPATTVAPSLVQSSAGTVTCERGTWDGSVPMTFDYAWTRAGAAVPGATTAELPASAREGLACTVTATNRGGTTSSTASVPVPPPPAPPVAGTVTPSVTSRPAVTTPPRRPSRPLRSRVALPGSATVRGGVAHVRVRCAATGRRCSGTLRLTLRVRTGARGSAAAGAATTVPGSASARRRAPVRGRARRRIRTLVVGSVRYAIPAGATATLRVRLSRTARRRLAAAPRRRLRVQLVTSGGTRRSLVLRAAPTRHGR